MSEYEMEGIHELAKCCEEPGLWTIESLQVRRLRPRPIGKGRRRSLWVIVWEPGVRSEHVVSFREAQAKIVDAINGIGPYADVFK